MSPDVAASVKARLLNEANRRGEVFELFLVRYACERFLYRLGASEVRNRCTLKGAGLLTVWMADPYRATRDVDLLASGDSHEAGVRSMMETICRVPCPEDGIVFALDGLSVTAIRDEQRYAGQRAILRAYLGKTRLRLQVDFGFGDALSVSPDEAELPTLIDRLPPPRVRAYPRVATVAEKFEAMVQLGHRNSRMKDFHDLWALSEAFPFDGPSLREAISRCFARRGTVWTTEIPDALTSAFYSNPDVDRRWTDYLRKGQFRAQPPRTLETVGDRIIRFLGPVRESIVADSAFGQWWPAGGTWRRGPATRAAGKSDV
jgi:hypothetical protein